MEILFLCKQELQNIDDLPCEVYLISNSFPSVSMFTEILKVHHYFYHASAQNMFILESFDMSG